MLNGLDLFSGIGGLATALAPWVRPLAYCENDRYAQAVLLSRMSDGSIVHGPIWDDIRTLTTFELGRPWVEIDIVYGGFPCQDISAAGRGAGLAGERSGLFFQLVRLVEEARPTFVFLENVPAIRTRGLVQVIRTFSYLRYDCRWTCISAAEVGAVQIRKRWFLLAHSKINRLERLEYNKEPWATQRQTANMVSQKICQETIDRLARTADELPRPMDQVRTLGNAVVPLQAREAFVRLMGLDIGMDVPPDIARYGLEEG